MIGTFLKALKGTSLYGQTTNSQIFMKNHVNRHDFRKQHVEHVVFNMSRTSFQQGTSRTVALTLTQFHLVMSCTQLTIAVITHSISFIGTRQHYQGMISTSWDLFGLNSGGEGWGAPSLVINGVATTINGLNKWVAGVISPHFSGIISPITRDGAHFVGESCEINRTWTSQG